MTIGESATRNGGGNGKPDPSTATLAALWHEVESLKELFAKDIDGIKHAIEVAHLDLVRVPTDVQESVGALKALINAEMNVHEEKFSSIQTQFKERDERTKEAAVSIEKAINAALTAQKEAADKQQASNVGAITKSEFNFSELLKTQGTGQNQSKIEIDRRLNDQQQAISNLDGKFGQLAMQMATRAESSKDNSAATNDSTKIYLAVLMAFLALISVAATVVNLMRN